jgi:hypothetical protein
VGDRKPTFVKCPGLRSGVTINKSAFISIVCRQFPDRVILQKSGLNVRNQSAEDRGENKELCRCGKKWLIEGYKNAAFIENLKFHFIFMVQPIMKSEEMKALFARFEAASAEVESNRVLEREGTPTPEGLQQMG